jgi:hypothetical protein
VLNLIWTGVIDGAMKRGNTNSILALLKDVSTKDWPAIFSNIENVLVSIGSPPQSDVIQIKNDGSCWVQGRSV